MKRNDYMRLAKESLASRKKNTRSTVRGISFGLIFLIPVLFIALSVYVELTAKLNNAPETLSLRITASAERSGLEPQAYSSSDDETISTVLTSQNLDEVSESTDGTKYYYEQLDSDYNYNLITKSSSNPYGKAAFQFAVDDGNAVSYTYAQSNMNSNNYSQYTHFAAILDMEKSNIDGALNPAKIAPRYGGSIYLDNYNKGFKDGGKGQVIVSELLLERLGLTAESVYGKSITLSYSDNTDEYINYWQPTIYIDNDNSADNNDYSVAESLRTQNITKQVNLCNRYEVVGIIKKKVSEDAITAAPQSDIYKLMSNALFFTTASRDNPDGTVAQPFINDYESDSEYGGFLFIATYPDGFDALNQEYIGVSANKFTSIRSVNISYENMGKSKHTVAPQETLVVDAKDFAELEKIVNQTANTLGSLLGDEPRNTVVDSFASSLFSMVSILYSVFSYVILVLSIFGGIVFFAAMVNLFNSIAHSVDTRKHYLGVMRAIGARGNMISKLYLAESLTIFRRASIWIIIFAGAICIGLWFLINFLFSYTNDMMNTLFGASFSINAIYIPIAIFGALAVLVVIGVVFSYSLSRRVSTRPITEILVD